METIRLAVHSWLPAAAVALLPGLLTALHESVPKSLAKRPRAMAIDLHLTPFDGGDVPTSYRQMREGLVKTRRKSAVLRLLADRRCADAGQLDSSSWGA